VSTEPTIDRTAGGMTLPPQTGALTGRHGSWSLMRSTPWINPGKVHITPYAFIPVRQLSLTALDSNS